MCFTLFRSSVDKLWIFKLSSLLCKNWLVEFCKSYYSISNAIIRFLKKSTLYFLLTLSLQMFLKARVSIKKEKETWITLNCGNARHWGAADWSCALAEAENSWSRATHTALRWCSVAHALPMAHALQMARMPKRVSFHQKQTLYCEDDILKKIMPFSEDCKNTKPIPGPLFRTKEKSSHVKLVTLSL